VSDRHLRAAATRVPGDLSRPRPRPVLGVRTWLRGVSPLLFRPGIRLSARVVSGLPVTRACTGEDSPFHPFSPVETAVPSRASRARARSVVSSSPTGRRGPRRVDSPSLRQWLARGSRASSVGERGLVSVPAPAVSRSGFAPGHLPGRWGDFPHVPGVATASPRDRDTGTGLPLPPPRRRFGGLSPSVGRAASTSAVRGSATFLPRPAPRTRPYPRPRGRGLWPRRGRTP